MGKSISQIGEPYDNTLKLLDKIKNYSKIKICQYKISDTTLVSYGFRGCRGFILYDNKKTLLAHVLPRLGIESVIEETRKYFTDIKNCSAIIIGGYKPKTLKKQCKKYKINVKKCISIDEKVKNGYYGPETDKDIIVFPKQKKVIMIRDEEFYKFSM